MSLPLSSDDKTQHMLAFAALSVLASLAFPVAPLSRIAERLSFLGALIEVVQAMPSIHRDCDIFDWLADTAAILAALSIVWVMRQRIRRPRIPSDSVEKFS